MKKSYAILIVALLMLPMLTVAAPVRASSGHPQFGATDSGTLTLANENITLKAGTMDVSMIDGVPITGNFSIVLTYNSTSRVIFSGAGFDLYLSKDYYSVISADDKMYASGFNVNDLNLTGLKQVNITNPLLKGGKASFYIGTVDSPVTSQVVIGPIPFDITADYKYIKVFDGSSGSVAVAGIIDILPSFTLTPDSGAPCTTVTLTGVALPAGVVYNITYGSRFDNELIGQATSGSDGKLNLTWNVADTKDPHGAGDWDWIAVHVIVNSTGVQIDQPSSIRFIEYQSYFTGLSVGNEVVNTDFVNNTGPYAVHVFDDVGLNGSYFCLSCGHVTITVDGITLATPTLNSDGNFTADFTVPVLSNGNHVVQVTDCDKTMTFNITVLPTLIATPDHGPAGTNVTFTAYGFPANSPVYLYWEDDSLCVSTVEEFNIANATTGADGQFNVTVTYVVVVQTGGYHDIDAQSVFYNSTQILNEEDDESGTEIASTQFLVTPTVFFTSPIDINGSVFYMMGTGLDPSVGYAVNIDNQAFATGYEDYYGAHVVYSDDCGNLSIALVAAGFTPGLHVAALYWDANYYDDGAPGNYTPAAYGTFTVTGDHDPTYQAITQINSSFATELREMHANITSIQNDVATITTNTNTIQVAVSALDAKVTSLQGSVATVQTTLGTLQGTVTSIQGNVATIQTQVGQIKANTDSIKGFLPVDLTPVWIAVILSLIAAIASIYGIIVIRSKIAA